MKLFKLIAITLSIMLAMSLSACESKPTMHVSDETEAVATDVTTAVEVTTVPEITTTEETTAPPKDYSIEVELNGEVITVPVKGIPYRNDTISEDTQLYLAERAAQLIIDLDRDFDNTVGQIRFEPLYHGDEFDYEEALGYRFNNNERHFRSVSKVQVKERKRVEVAAGFSNIHMLIYITIDFEFENGEWVINNVFDTTGGS